MKIYWLLCDINELILHKSWRKENIQFCKKALNLNPPNQWKFAFRLHLTRYLDPQDDFKEIKRILQDSYNESSSLNDVNTQLLFSLALSHFYLCAKDANRTFEYLNQTNDLLHKYMEGFENNSNNETVNLLLIDSDNHNNSNTNKENLSEQENLLLYFKTIHLIFTILYSIQLGEFNASLNTFEQLRAITESNSLSYSNEYNLFQWITHDSIRIIYLYLGSLCYLPTSFNLSLQYVEEGLSKCINILNPEHSNYISYFHIKFLEIKFYLYYSKSEFSESLKVYEEIESILKDTDDMNLKLIYYEISGILFYATGDMKKSIEFLSLALGRASDPERKCIVALYIALIYTHMNNFAQVSRIFEEYSKLAYESSNILIKITTLYIESMIDISLERYELAESKLKIIMDLNNSRSTSTQVTILSFLSMNDLYMKLHKVQDVPRILTTSLAISQKYGDSLLIGFFMRDLSRTYNALGDSIRFSESLCEYKKISDLILHKQAEFLKQTKSKQSSN